MSPSSLIFLAGIKTSASTSAPRFLYWAKLSLNVRREIKTFQEKHKLKQSMTTEPELQKIFTETQRKRRRQQGRLQVWG
jgi:hypothetical protein